MSAIISLEKLNQLIGLGLVNEEMLQQYETVLFESNKENGGIMVNISAGVEGKIEPVATDRCVVGKETVRQLRDMGLIEEAPILSKDIIVSKFVSKYENQGDLLNFSKPSQAGLDDLFAETKAEVSEDGSLDLGVDHF